MSTHDDSVQPVDPGDTDVGEVAPGRARSPLRTTLVLVGVLVVAFLGAATMTTMLDVEDAPGQGTDPGADVAGPVPLDERIPATATAPLPQMALPGFADGPERRLDDYHGQPAIVNFWASWCTPCVEEMPDFQELAESHGDRVAVLGVNVMDAPSNAEGFAQELGITYDLASDPQGEAYEAVEAFGMPTTLFVDPSGTIVYRHTGLVRADELTALVQDHLGVPATR